MYWCSSGSLPHGQGGTRNPNFPYFFSLLASTHGDALTEELTDLQPPLLPSPPLAVPGQGTYLRGPPLPSAHGDSTIYRSVTSSPSVSWSPFHLFLLTAGAGASMRGPPLPSSHGDGTDLQVSDISPICFMVSLSSLPPYRRRGRLHAFSSTCRLHASPPSPPRDTSMLAREECRFIKMKWAPLPPDLV